MAESGIQTKRGSDQGRKVDPRPKVALRASWRVLGPFWLTVETHFGYSLGTLK